MADPHTELPSPAELLSDYLDSDRAEQSFSQLVERLGGLVFSSALRRTNNRSMAEEIVQTVFAILARKAASLRTHPNLSAWVFQTTKLECAKAMRSETRRLKKQAAYADQEKLHHPGEDPPAWNEALPALDESLDQLRPMDREILMARFFENQRFSEIAAATGKSEAACKMQVKRSLGKLANLLRGRGVTLSVTAIATGLSTELAKASPLSSSLVASKALASSASLSSSTILINTLQTMSTTKTVTLTAAVVIAIAAIPFSQQRAKASEMQTRLSQMESGHFSSAAESSRRGSGRNVSTRASVGLPAAPDDAKGRRELIRDLCSWDGATSQLARQRVKAMTDEERAKLLQELSSFPLGFELRKSLVAFLIQSNTGTAPGQILDQLVKGGFYRSFGGGETPDQNFLTCWARTDVAAAVQWYEQKMEGDDLLGGLGDETRNDLYLHLMPGVIEVDPELALDLYARTPEELRDTRTGMFWPISQLSQRYSRQLVDEGNDAGMRRLLDLTNGPARNILVGSATWTFARAGRLEEGLAFLDQNMPQPWNPRDYPTLNYGDSPDDRDSYVNSMARGASSTVGIERSLDWLLENVSSPEAARQTVMQSFGNFDNDRQRAEAMRWLDRQPSGQVRDAAHANLVWQQTVDGNYDRALEGTANIEGESIRSQMVDLVEQSRQLYQDTNGRRRVGLATGTPPLKF